MYRCQISEDKWLCLLPHHVLIVLILSQVIQAHYFFIVGKPLCSAFYAIIHPCYNQKYHPLHKILTLFWQDGSNKLLLFELLGPQQA